MRASSEMLDTVAARHIRTHTHMQHKIAGWKLIPSANREKKTEGSQ